MSAFSPLDSARAVFDTEIDGLRAVRDSLGDAFASAFGRLRDCLAAGGKIVVTGVGKNVYVGEKLAATLSSTGAPSVFLNAVQALHGDLGVLAPADVLVVLSYSGESDEIKNLLPAVRRLGNAVVGLTGNPASTLASLSDEVVSVAVPREACSFGLVPTTSTTATLALCDALAVALLEARGFTRDDFARYHPAGAIGKALLTRVSDIMRRGDDVAAVAPSASVRDAILAMTRAKAGCCVAVDAGGRLCGIFTDGDFRRHLARAEGGEPLATPLSEVMTREPVHVRDVQLAVDALRVFEAHHIDDLPVLGDDGLFRGVVDIQDLPRFKVM